MSSDKYTILDMQSFASSKDGMCLSLTYVHSQTHLEWRCKYGHEWKAKWNTVQQGKWCPKCRYLLLAKKFQRYTIEDMHQMAQSRGGRCLSTIYTDRDTGLQWICDKGHRWEAPPHRIIVGKWCRQCAIVYRAKLLVTRTIEDMQIFAASKGGQCLSHTYISMEANLLWVCHLGHEWLARPGNVLRGKWCPECKVGIGERICRTYFEQIFGVPFPKSRPKWLINEKGRPLELDGYAQSIGVAFEHQGLQHYEYVKHFHRDSSGFERIRYLDLRKKELCKKHDVLLIEVPSVQEILGIANLKKYIINACSQYGIPVPISAKRQRIVPSFAYQFRNYPLQLPLFEGKG